MHRKIVAVILAAGQGRRMVSDRPKVLHRVAGRTLLEWVLETVRQTGSQRCLVVVGHGAEEVKAAVEAPDIVWVEQTEQRGTGHALAQVEGHLRGESTLLVLPGDAPLVTAGSLQQLLRQAEGAWGAMAVAEPADPGSLGRVLRRPNGGLERIVEVADASAAELAVGTVNAGFYTLPVPEVFDYLRQLGDDNRQAELYLTDALTLAAAQGRQVRIVQLADDREALGVNEQRELAAVQRALVRRLLEGLMRAGVTVVDPARTVVEAEVRVGANTVIHPGVSLLGHTEIGSGCILHQGVWVRDSRLDDGVTVEPYSVLEAAEVGRGCRLGPFAHLASASILLEGGRVGSFQRLGARHEKGRRRLAGGAEAQGSDEG